MSPTPRLAGALGLAALLTAIVGPIAGLPVALALIGMAVADARSVATLPSVTWKTPAVLARGRPAALSVTVGPGPARRVLIRQPLCPGLGATPDRSVGLLHTELTGHRRGSFRLDGPVVRLEGRLGLGRWTHTVSDARQVKVVADLPNARRLALDVRRGIRPGGSRAGRRLIGLGTDFEAVRDYQPDDDVRQVNWSATARVGRPMSNVYRLEQEREVVCLLDGGRLMAAPVGDRTRLDAAADAVCAVALVADQAGDRCGLTVFDETIRVQLAPRRAGAPQVIDAVSASQFRLVDSRYELAFQSLLRRKRALVIVFTDLLDGYAARSLLAATPMLVRRHAVLIATTRDPELAGMADRIPHDLDDAYEAAVALSMLGEARRIVAHLTRARAEVLSSPPQDLPMAAVDAYLRLKSRARL